MNKNNLQMAFALRLKRKMKERKMTQMDLAKALGVDQGAVSRWVNGHSLPRNLDTIGDIAALLDCAPVWLMFGIEVGQEDRDAVLAYHSLPPTDKAALRAIIETMSAKTKNDQ